MSSRTLIIGDAASNALQGGAGGDLIYGYDPDTVTVSSIAVEKVAGELPLPVFVGAPAGDTGRLFIAEQGGLVRILDLATGELLATPFLNLTGTISTGGIYGLIGLAFHPDFAENGLVYVNVSNADGDTEIRSYKVSADDPNRVDPASGKVLITVDQQPIGPADHFAGWIGFGPDGYLYITTGDGHLPPQAQDIDDLRGKVLRIDVDGDNFPGDPARNYAIPADNPFVGGPGADEIYALGLRNPWRDSFDRGLGDLYIADVGEDRWEEINIGAAGANYGWNLYEGPDTFAAGTPGGGTLTAPAFYYSHNGGAASITGGYVYRGQSDGLQGHYIFADWVAQKIFDAHQVGGTWVMTDLTPLIPPTAGLLSSIVSFGEDGRGNLYVVNYTGDIFRLTPNAVSSDVADTIYGGDGGDMVFGGTGDDIVSGDAGDDDLNGGTGNDFLIGSNGHDILIGGDGHDAAVGGDGADALDGGTGNDYLEGDSGKDALTGGDGDDNLVGGDDGDTVYGGIGNDLIAGDAGDDQIFGGNGLDNIIGGAGADSIDGDAGNDYIEGNGEADTLSGGGGDDIIVAGDDNDFVSGGDGNDLLSGEHGDDTLDGGAGLDTLVGGGGNDTLSGGDDADYLEGNVGADLIDGEGGDDNVAAGDDSDTVYGGDGHDLLGGGGGDDMLDGGAGNDGLIGGAGGDTIYGGDDSDYIEGNADADAIFGGSGDDFIDGGAAGDTMTGGGGNDIFLLRAGDADADMISDFAGNGAGAGDLLYFIGFGTAAAGAHLTQVDATHWTIHSADGLAQNTITLSNGASIHLSDYLFA